MSCLVLVFSSNAHARVTCFPLNADVVSLGEATARNYTVRRIETIVAEHERMLEATGRELTRTIRNEPDCAPFPNLIGADEWRCTATARVCARMPD